VRPEDIHPKFREALAGSRLSDWEDHHFSSFMHAVFDGFVMPDGQRSVGVDRKWDRPATVFALRYPPLDWRTPHDPAFLPWQKKAIARAEELRADQEFWPPREGFNHDARVAQAFSQTFREIRDAIAEEGISKDAAKACMNAAGL
jgi:hypothetical protein